MFRIKRKTSSVGRSLRIAILFYLAMPTLLHSQDVSEASVLVKPKVEIFAGAELHYRDIFYGKIYEVVVNVTCEGKSVSGKVYGSVTVAASTYNRQHNGGTGGGI